MAKQLYNFAIHFSFVWCPFYDRSIILALAECLSPEDAKRGQVFPHISNIRMVSRRVAVAVIEEAVATGIATKISLDDRKDIDAYVAKKMYYPEYVPLVEKRTISI